jgi:hypothetical protein
MLRAELWLPNRKRLYADIPFRRGLKRGGMTYTKVGYAQFMPSTNSI